MTASISPSVTNGTITLLFVEVDGATTLWDAHPTRFPQVLEACSQTLKETLAGNGSRLIKDGFNGATYFFAFESAAVALARATAALVEIRQKIWPHVFADYGVRAALVTGVPIPVGDDYVGPLVNRCARMIEIAAHWQILVSEATLAEVAGVAPEGLALVYLGVCPLRDVDDSVPLYEVCHAALPQATTRQALPRPVRRAPLTSFVGREAERETLACLLRRPETRLLTLLGAGGCGKTRLLLETLPDVEGAFPDGVIHLSFRQEVNEEQLLASLAQALGLTAGQGAEGITREALSTALRDRRCLLALDNFERLRMHTVLLRELLRGTPGLTCLVTSRVRLRVAEETLFRVPPLNPEEAVRLLYERARTVRPDFAITPENAATVRAICAQLDRLPLALELAAPLLRGLSPGQLLARMRERKLDFISARRDMETRHQTLRHCLDWSYAMLSETERGLFARLSVFQGEFSLEAAQVVCATPEESSETLSETLHALHDNSLLTSLDSESQSRYQMLDLVREFASELLRAHEAEMREIRDRHAGYYAGVVRDAHDQYTAAGDNAYLQRCEREMDNIRAGMAWARNTHDHALFADYVQQLAPYYIEQGRWQEYRLCAPLALATLEAEENWASLCQMLRSDAKLARRAGRLSDAIYHLERALQLAEEKTEDRAFQCETVYNLGLVLKDTGDLDGAQARFQETMMRAQAIGYDMMRDVARCGLGDLALCRNDPTTAEYLFAEVRDSFRQRGEHSGVANAEFGLGQAALARNHVSSAHRHFRECLHLRARMGERYSLLSVLHAMAALLLKAGRFAAAAPLFYYLRHELEAVDGVLRQEAESGWEACQRLQEREEIVQPFCSCVETLTDAITYASNADLLR